MLVIISDTHLTDGTSGETIRAGAFSLFRERLRDLAYQASWRRGDKYKPIEELHLVLLGDILDVIRSTKWLKENGAPSSVRPWSDSQDPAFVSKVSSITETILTKNDKSLAIMKSLSRGNAITVPVPGPNGKVEKNSPHQQVAKVHIHYLVGNHDWFYRLPYPLFNPIRKKIVDALGLNNSPDAPFPHDPEESPPIMRALSQHAVYARHGDTYDPFNYDQDRNKSSLGDAIVVELVDRFAMTVREQMRNVLPKACLDGLNEIDNLRPTFIIPVWVDSLLRRTCPDGALRNQVKAQWDQLVDELLKVKFVQGHHSFFHIFDKFEELEWGLKFSKGVFRGNLSRLLAWIGGKFGTHDSSYYRHACGEAPFKSRSARFIVYGHTHRYEVVPLDSTINDNRPFDQVYINSGTWRPYHELARLHPEHQEFVRYQVMTYLAFYNDDERGGRPFESWSGVLAPD